MKIMFVISGLGFGGAQRVLTVLANSLLDLGHSVEIVTTNYGEKPAYQIKEGISHINIISEGLPGIISLDLCCKLRQAIKKSKPEIVISFMSEMNTLTIIAMGGLKIPVVVSERNDPNRVPHDKMKKLARDIAYNYADGFVFQTNAAKEYFNKSVQSRSTVILNPIDPQGLPEVYQGKRKKRIVAVNRLRPQKNIASLIKSFSLVSPRYPDYELDIYGEGRLRGELTLLAASLGLSEKVIFFGNKSDVLELIADASMFVLASDYEGMPNALIEALAMGLPCIATDCPIGGPAMLIQHNINGLLVPVNDHAALANAMLEMLDDPMRAELLGKEAIKIRERVDLIQIVSEWENYLSQVMGSSQN